MLPGTIVNGHFSKCCNASVSPSVYSIWERGVRVIKEKEWYCNKCRQVTERVVKPTWVITDKGKYKKL